MFFRFSLSKALVVYVDPHEFLSKYTKEKRNNNSNENSGNDSEQSVKG